MSILAIYVAFAGGVAGILFLTVPPLFAEAEELVQDFPDFYERARSTVEGWSEEYTERIPVELRTQIEEAVAAGGNVLAEAALGIAQRTVSGVSNAVTIVIGLAVMPFFLFYLLKDRERVIGGLYPMLSERGQMHTRNVISIANGVIGSYVRGQLLSATVVGVLVFIGLSVLGIKFAAILGLVAGLFGLIPIIGPLLGAVPGLLVTLASSPSQTIWVAVVYVGGAAHRELPGHAADTEQRGAFEPGVDHGHPGGGERDSGAVGRRGRGAACRAHAGRVRVLLRSSGTAARERQQRSRPPQARAGRRRQ